MQKILSLFIGLSMMGTNIENINIDTTAPIVQEIELADANEYSNGSSRFAMFWFMFNEEAKSYSLFVEKDYYEKNELSVEEIIDIAEVKAELFGDFETDNLYGKYDDDYDLGMGSYVNSSWFKPETEYLFVVIGVDEAGNVSEPSIVEFVTDSATTGAFEIEASYLGRNFDTNKMEFLVSSDDFASGVTFSYIAIPKNENAKQPTYAQVVAGVDGDGNPVSIKGSVITDKRNYEFLGVDVDDVEYDVYIVGTHQKSKSDVIKNVVTLDKDVTPPEIYSFYPPGQTGITRFQYLDYQCEISEPSKVYMVIVSRDDARTNAKEINTPEDIKNIVLGNKTLGSSVEYFCNVDYFYPDEYGEDDVWLPDGLPYSKDDEYICFITIEDSAGNLSNDMEEVGFNSNL